MSLQPPTTRGVLLWVLITTGSVNAAAVAATPAQRGGCGTLEATNSVIAVADSEEPGERLRVEGYVLDPDGQPAAGVAVRVFHTDAQGYYSPGGMDEEDARLCGVFRSAEDGSYQIDTIVPAPYATGRGPAPHIHFALVGSNEFATLTWKPAPATTDPSSGAREGRARPLVPQASGGYRMVYDLRLESNVRSPGHSGP